MLCPHLLTELDNWMSHRRRSFHFPKISNKNMADARIVGATSAPRQCDVVLDNAS